jgi:hypothetical protein
MPQILVDGVIFALDEVSQEIRESVEFLLAADARILELQRDLGITQTARNAYVQAAKALLQNEKGFSAG